MNILIFILCLIIIYVIVYLLLYYSVKKINYSKYNMQQIVKQSILLEEHLTNKNKRCRDCITKHFQHIIGLAEEAQMLATTNCNKFPLLSESVIIYNDLFNDWFKNREDESKILEISDKLRIHRKKLIAIYFFDDNYDINNFSKSSMG